MSEVYQNPQAEEIEAIKRIAGTQDGLLLHRYLRRVLEAVVDIESDGALRTHTGRRTLARDLMRHMADGLLDDRSGDNAPILTRSGGTSAERPRARGAGRRITADTAVAGWDEPAAGDSGGNAA